MILCRNDWIEVSPDDPAYYPISSNLRYEEQGSRRVFKKLKNGKTTFRDVQYHNIYNLYERGDNRSIYLPVGVLSLIRDTYFSSSRIKDMRKFPISKSLNFTLDFEKYRDILPGITLRDDQMICIRKMLLVKRGIIQAATGMGKTELMCAFFKILENELGYIPTAVVMEPTINLVHSTVRRMQKYGIRAVDYSDERNVLTNTVSVCHPASLGNDIKKDEALMDNVVVIIGDECHHLKSDTFRNPTHRTPNLEYSLGVSASAIDAEHVGKTDIKQYDYEEALSIGATGPLLVDITPKYLVERGILATPKLFMIENPADEPIGQNMQRNWNELVKKRLYSEARNVLVCKCADIFREYSRKTLILVSTIEWARILLSLFDEMGISNCVRASYGSGKFEKISNGKVQKCDEDVMRQFESGDCKILIGTTHLYEGVDVPNLDALILAFGGKKDRLQVQGVGRVLRRSKTGKYAYIVDFTDSNGGILKTQSNIRLRRYRDLIGIPQDSIYYGITVEDAKNIFMELENL